MLPVGCTDVQDSVEQRVAGCLAALLLPIRHIEVPVRKGKTEPLVAHVTAKSIKCCKADTNAVVSLHHELPELSLIHSMVQGTLSYLKAQLLRLRACALPKVGRVTYMLLLVTHLHAALLTPAMLGRGATGQLLVGTTSLWQVARV